MMNESPNPTMKELWQHQPVEGIPMSLEMIRKRAGKFEKKVLWRNVREYAGGAIAAALFASFFVKSHDIFFKVACAMMIAGLAYMAYQLHRRASARSMPTDLGTANSLQFHRSELERQRDFISHIWRWYLGPLIPGMVVFTLASALADSSAHGRVRQAIADGIMAFSVIFVWRLNVRAARCLQRRIDELYAAESAVE
jgi:hypothetical protein